MSIKSKSDAVDSEESSDSESFLCIEGPAYDSRDFTIYKKIEGNLAAEELEDDAQATRGCPVYC